MSSFVWVQTKQIERIEVALVNSSGFLTGATVTLKIRRKSDGYYWTGSAWQATAATVNMTEVDSVNDPGKYYYNFDMTGLSADDYFLTAVCAAASNAPQGGQIRSGGYVDYITSTIGQALPFIQTFGGAELEDIRKTLKKIEDSISSLKGTVSSSMSEASISTLESLQVLAGKISKEVMDSASSIKEALSSSISASNSSMKPISEAVAATRASVESSIALLGAELVKAIAEIPRDGSEDVIRQVKIVEKNLMELSGIKEKISFMESVLVKTCDTKTLEEIIKNVQNGG